MSWDYLGTERQFLDHLAPIYRLAGGRFYVNADLHDYATALGIDPIAPLEPDGDDSPILVASYGDLKRARRAGRTRLALMEHGYGQSFSNDHPSYAGGRDRDDVSLFLVPNEHSAARNRASNPSAQTVIIGCPKLDHLPQREGNDGPVIAFSSHWDAWSVSPEATGTISYYRKVLPELAKRFSMIGHAHPRVLRHPYSPFKRHYRKAGMELVENFTEVCRRADVYVCDYSSTIYEFAATGRPVVVLNGPQYRRTIDHGLRYWQAASVGVQVDRPDQLEAAIHLALEDRPEQRKAREAALKVVYRYRSGAAQRAVKALSQWAVPMEQAA